jgi:hypothetical protein
MESSNLIKDIILNGSPAQKRAVFEFEDDNVEKILVKYKLFSKSQYIRYFKSGDAPFHDDMVRDYIRGYLGIENINEVAYRGSAKTSLKKLFDVFVLLNDKRPNPRKYMKVLTKDLKNSKQVVTDVYNMIVEVKHIYGDIFEKEGDTKREETMGSFTTKDQRKYTAGTVGQTQRGHVQDAFRPDYIWFDDVEDRDSIRSQVKTVGIIEKIGEAIDGMSPDGTYVLTANYISEYGAVQWFLDKKNAFTRITPMEGPDGKPTWDRFTEKKMQAIKDDADDWWGEFQCDPTHSDDKFFDLNLVDRMIQEAKEPMRQSAGVNYYLPYKPNHRYAIGADISGGVGLDSCALTLFDFTTGEVVATYHNNEIAPDIFAHELKRVGEEFGTCLIAPERNNMGVTTIDTLKSMYYNIYKEHQTNKAFDIQTERLGWHTNSRTKPEMFYAFRTAFNDGLITIYDLDLLKEMKSYTKFDLVDQATALATRHFDLLTSAVIAWQMKDHAGDPMFDAQQEYRIQQNRKSKGTMR